MCFTLNNYTTEDELHIGLLALDEGTIGLVYGREVGESGTPHLQGYIEFRHQRSFTSAKKAISMRAHLQQAKGTRLQNYAYCTKEDDYERVPDDDDFWQEKSKAGAYASALQMVYEGTYDSSSASLRAWLRHG